MTIRGNVHLTLTFGEPLDPRKTPYLTARLNFGAGDNLIMTAAELFALLGSDDGSPLPEAVIDALQVESDKRSDEQQQAIRSHFSAHALQTERLRIDLPECGRTPCRETQRIPRHGDERVGKTPTHLHPQAGRLFATDAPRQHGHPGIPPETRPQCRQPPQTGGMDPQPDHPLTARVYVNRVCACCSARELYAPLPISVPRGNGHASGIARLAGPSISWNMAGT
ncbi:MAG: hypothetical protein R3C12_22450 [Planctomycetaceae bacterium]